MKHLLLVFLALPSAHAEYCNWGIVSPAPIQCDGETYYRGSPACDSGFYEDIFCHRKFIQDGKACSADTSAKTLECYNRMHAPVAPKPAPKPPKETPADTCNWGIVGPKSFTCDGRKYCYGSAACTSGFYQDVFCRMDLCRDGKTCAKDTAPATVACFNAMRAPRAAAGEALHIKPNSSTGATK